MLERGPKVTILGAGSLFFGRQAIWQMVHSPHLNKGTLALVDTDPVRLAKLDRLARMVVEANGVDLRIESSLDRRDLLAGSDFVVLSFARDTVRYRGLDTQISAKYGIRMCSGDTIGPGGVFRALRELPVILDCARDVMELCPDAWVINYINPSTVNGMALKRYAPDAGLAAVLHAAGAAVERCRLARRTRAAAARSCLHQQHHGLRRDALAAAGEAELLAGRRLDADGVHLDA